MISQQRLREQVGRFGGAVLLWRTAVGFDIIRETCWRVRGFLDFAPTNGLNYIISYYSRPIQTFKAWTF